MRIKALSLPLVVVLSAGLTGCNEFHSKSSYFEGIVLAEYFQSRRHGTDDNFTLTFNEAGTFQVSFFERSGKKSSSSLMPKDFVVTIDRAPRVKVITQYRLPDRMKVTITYNGGSESHDFE